VRTTPAAPITHLQETLTSTYCGTLLTAKAVRTRSGYVSCPSCVQHHKRKALRTGGNYEDPLTPYDDPEPAP
jgi:hypothetical protein